MRVSVFVDGFNFYHAVDDLRKHHLKWVDIRKLGEQFAPKPQYTLTHIYYFSAYATWRPDAYARHREYVKALKSVGVTPVMAKFKEKFRQCYTCKSKWKDHEEKETDVNVALFLVREAFRDSYDRALLITGDSDICPAVRMVRADFPMKQIRILAPAGRPYSMDLVTAAGGPKSAARMQEIHMERALFPELVLDDQGKVVATRPLKYAPPSA
jgi:uncharacterized LabA/DUF88 family protein